MPLMLPLPLRCLSLIHAGFHATLSRHARCLIIIFYAFRFRYFRQFRCIALAEFSCRRRLALFATPPLAFSFRR